MSKMDFYYPHRIGWEKIPQNDRSHAMVILAITNPHS